MGGRGYLCPEAVVSQVSKCMMLVSCDVLAGASVADRAGPFVGINSSLLWGGFFYISQLSCANCEVPEVV